MESASGVQSSSSKSRSLGIELKFFERSKRKLTKAAVGARFYKILDILMEIVACELGLKESQDFMDVSIMMGISVGFHVKMSDFSPDVVRGMRDLAHQLAMAVSHYQKMSLIYDGEHLLELVSQLCAFVRTEGADVLDESTHQRINRVVSFFTEPVLDKMFMDDGIYKDSTQRLMELLDSLIEEGRI
eukprot:scpid74838/ scgid32966/ 